MTTKISSSLLLSVCLLTALTASAAEVVVESWVQRFSGGVSNLQDQASKVVMDVNGDIIVTGTTCGDAAGGGMFTIKYSGADGSVLWIRRRDCPTHPAALAVDADGNVMVTGTFQGDYYAAKYAGADGALLWEQRYNGPANADDRAVAVAVDADGNVVVTGSSAGSSSGADYCTVKYAAEDGALLWEQRFEGPGDDLPSALCVDSRGNVVVTGGSLGLDSDWDYYTVKYAAADGALLWEQRYNGPANREDKAAAVAVDFTGNVVVTGYSFSSQPLWSSDFYTAKYAAHDGSLLWERHYNGPGSVRDRGHSIAVDTLGNVVVAGQSDYVYRCAGQDICGDIGDWYTAKYAADGSLLWEQRYRDWASADGARAVVAVDADGNAIVSGQPLRYGACLSAFAGVCTNTPSDYFAVKYAPADGVLLWEQRYNGPADGDDYALGMALGPKGSIVITGLSNGESGQGTTYDIITVKYVTITYPTPIVLSLAVTPDGARLRLTGDAGRTYRLQRALNPAGPWTTFAFLTAPSDGAVEHLDPAPLSSPTFYRVAAP